MPKVGRIDVSVQDLMAIAQECESCAGDLYRELNKCHEQMEGLMDDGWESESGDKLMQEYANMAETHFQGYFDALKAYGEFCNQTIAEYEALDESELKSTISGKNLQSFD